MSAPGTPVQGPTTQEQIAKLLMMTDRHLRNLIREGWIPKDLALVGAVQGYIRYRDHLDQKRQQNTAQAEAQQLKVDEQRLKLRVAEGEYVELDLAMSAFSDVLGALRADLETLPSKVAGRDARVRANVENMIANILNAAADKCEEAEAALSPVGGRASKAAGELARRLGARKSKVPFNRGRPRTKRPVAHPIRDSA